MKEHADEAMAFLFFDPTKEVRVTQGHLPHWDQEGATYFITWRTADSIPKAVWMGWRDARDAWLRAHGIDPTTKDWRKQLEELPEQDRRDFRRFSKALEDELDAGHGECCLRQQSLAEVVAGTLHCFDGDRYVLGDFVVMPNHVHLLVGGMARNGMLKQVESWKKWSALKINEALGRRGRFWQDESFDHLVRNQDSFEKVRSYIAENPGKARLKKGDFVSWKRES
jgi:hypothetical protein